VEQHCFSNKVIMTLHHEKIAGEKTQIVLFWNLLLQTVQKPTCPWSLAKHLFQTWHL